MEQPLNCLLGLAECANFDATQVSGQIVGWFEVLGLGGIIFAISEFIEKSKFRTYILKFSGWFKWLFGLFLAGILLIIISQFLPLLPGAAIPVLGFPAAWEISSLIALTLFLFIFSCMSLRADWFIPKLKASNLVLFQRVLQNALLDEKSDDSIAAAAHFLEGRGFKNLRTFIKIAASRDQKGHGQAIIILKQYLSTQDYVHYLATTNFLQTLYWFKFWAKETSEGGPHFFFFQGLMRELYKEPNSWLSKEEESAGLSLSKPLHKAIYSHLEYLNIFCAFEYGVNFSTPHSIRRYFEGLGISLEMYFKDTQRQRGTGSPTWTLYNALTNVHFWSWHDLPEDKREAYDHPIAQQLINVYSFFTHRIPDLLGLYGNTPQLVQEEKSIQDNWVTDGLVECMFNYLEGLSMIKNSDIARTNAMHLSWIIFRKSLEDEVPKNVQNKLIEKIKERVMHSLEGAYSGSFPRLLLEIYGFEFNSGKSDSYELGDFIHKLFIEKIAPQALADEKFARTHLPSSWWVENGKEIFREDWEDYAEQMFPVMPTGESRIKLSDLKKKPTE